MPASRYPAAAAALTRIFQHRTLRRANGSTIELCGVSARSGTIQASEGTMTARGDYLISMPAATLVELTEGELITVDELGGRRFRIVWAPAPGNLNLARHYGADEVR